MKSLTVQIEHCLARPSVTEWLVSVRDEQEFVRAARHGVDIIDFKEPRRGALTPVESSVWMSAVNQIASSTQPGPLAGLPRLSAALGERDEAIAVSAKLPSQFAFAKAGPSGCTTSQAIRRLWTDVRGRLDPRIELVAVAYADAQLAQCIEPETVFLEVKRAGLRRCLLDTFTKDGRSSLQHLGMGRLSEIDRLAQRLGIWWALAGSITRQDVLTLAAHQVKPDCYAVRGDVCDQDRSGRICERRLDAWGEMLKPGAQRRRPWIADRSFPR